MTLHLLCLRFELQTCFSLCDTSLAACSILSVTWITAMNRYHSCWSEVLKSAPVLRNYHPCCCITLGASRRLLGWYQWLSDHWVSQFLKQYTANSHDVDIFQTLEMTELKLSLYHIFLCELNRSRVHFQRYFRHLAQLIGDMEVGSVFWKFHAPWRWLLLSWFMKTKPQWLTISLEQKRIISSGTYWDTKTIRII